MNRSDLKALTPVLEKLRRATREHRTVEMQYQGSQTPHPTQRRLDPYALVHRWSWWYVIGFCHVHGEARTFRVDRIRGVALLATTFSQISNFNLQEYLKGETQAQPHVMARLRFAPEAVNIVEGNRSYWETVETNPGGSVDVTFPAPTLEWAASTVLAYSPSAEVVAPPELRAMVSDWLEATIQKYKRGKHENKV
jgi:predicted DNA-binding transcriptional regulator YafY